MDERRGEERSGVAALRGEHRRMTMVLLSVLVLVLVFMLVFMLVVVAMVLAVLPLLPLPLLPPPGALSAPVPVV